MNFTLEEQNGEEFQFSLKITKAEAAALDGAALTALWGQIRQLTGANRIGLADEAEEAKTKPKATESAIFVAKGYKGLTVRAADAVAKNGSNLSYEEPTEGALQEEADLSSSASEVPAFYELLLDQLIAIHDIPIPKELEEEIQVVYNGALNSLKYQRMFGDYYQTQENDSSAQALLKNSQQNVMADSNAAETDNRELSGNPDGSLEEMAVPDYDDLYRQIAADVTRDYKENLLLKSIIRQENIDCTGAELETEALAMAEREHCSLDMIKKFMGDDYGFLKGDLLKKKAKQLICEHAIVLS